MNDARLDGRIGQRPLGLYPRIGLVALGVALYVLGFPKAGVYGLAWFALVPLFVASRDLTPGQGFRHWFAYCFLVNVFGFYWMAPITVPGFLLSAVLMALYSGLGGVVLSLARRNVPRLPYWVAAALAWGATEYVKCLGFYAFPWLAIGYSQARNLLAVQTAALFGVYGVSAVIIAFNALVAEAVERLRRRSWRKALLPWGAAALGLAMVIHLGGLLALGEPGYTERPVRAAILQGGIPQDLKWAPYFITSGETYRIYEHQVERAVERAGPDYLDLVIWPESSANCYLERTPMWATRVRGMVNRSGCRHLVGTQALDFEGEGGAGRHFNAAVLLEPGNPRALERYYKIHLVPFSETIPFGRDSELFKDLLKRASNFNFGWRMPLFEVTPGRGPAPLPAPEASVGDDDPTTFSLDERPELTAELLPVPPAAAGPVLARFGLLICFESIYPEMGLDYTRRGADFLVVITNDAWFRQSAAPYQHAEVSVLRAVESRVPVLRSANAGVSLWVDPWGRPHDETLLDTEDVVLVNIPRAEGPTPYMFWGDALPWAELGAFVLLALYAAVESYRRRGRGRRP
ncbi:MAG: apolipoprotein N-acyltransferase [Candidatus Coatesbacteria bacterium RBG_13_66_14]|uniref:Apolipoprotein N-acyltransferase n=1 Tax=Candidatus Coatesbacteria bacterium RBG_13_66_14 TaxID=1817816 RepID=A0A1F5EWR2_9BACT|nr:MAG: apolipoprotein N-acyltransferase [Candidatus Coatesbacteria bacterium RBG_13_66_14]